MHIKSVDVTCLDMSVYKQVIMLLIEKSIISNLGNIYYD